MNKFGFSKRYTIAGVTINYDSWIERVTKDNTSDKLLPMIVLMNDLSAVCSLC